MVMCMCLLFLGVSVVDVDSVRPYRNDQIGQRRHPDQREILAMLLQWMETCERCSSMSHVMLLRYSMEHSITVLGRRRIERNHGNVAFPRSYRQNLMSLRDAWSSWWFLIREVALCFFDKK